MKKILTGILILVFQSGCAGLSLLPPKPLAYQSQKVRTQAEANLDLEYCRNFGAINGNAAEMDCMFRRDYKLVEASQ